MIKFSLNEDSKKSIEKITGIKYDDIVAMDLMTLEKKIEKRIGKKLKFSNYTGINIGRPSVYMYLQRFIKL